MLIIPFVLGPTIIVTVNYILFATGILPPVIVQPPFTVPIFFGGFIATGGSWLAGIVQIVNFVIATIIYYPFFKKYEKQLIDEEKMADEGYISELRRYYDQTDPAWRKCSRSRI